MNLDPQYHLPPGRRAAVDALVSEFAHQLSTDLPTFLFPQTRPCAGAWLRTDFEPETQLVHRCPQGSPQREVRSCEQLGSP